MESQPNTKHVTVPHPVPRDPEQYRTTTHFSQRLRERFKNRAEWDRLIRETIERGQVRGTTPPEHAEANGGVQQYFAFNHDGVELLVGIRPAAFRDDAEQHLAVTIYEVDQ